MKKNYTLYNFDSKIIKLSKKFDLQKQKFYVTKEHRKIFKNNIDLTILNWNPKTQKPELYKN